MADPSTSVLATACGSSGADGPRSVRVLGVVASPEYFWPARSRQDMLPGAEGLRRASSRREALAERARRAARPQPGRRSTTAAARRRLADRRLTRLADRAGAADVLTRADQPSNSALQEDVNGFRELAILFPLLFLTAAALATGILMRRLVTAQRSIVGMLRACGYSRGQVVRHYLAFGDRRRPRRRGARRGGGGGARAALVTHAYTGELSIPVTLVRVSPLTSLLGLAFGVGVGAAGGGAAGCTRRRRAAGGGDAGFLAAAGGQAEPRRAPGPAVAAAAGALAHGPALDRPQPPPRRSRPSLGVVLALTLMLVSWGMIDTTQILVDRQFGEVERQDAELYFRGALVRRRASPVAPVAGVAAGRARRSRSRSRCGRTAAATRPPWSGSSATRRCTASSSRAAGGQRCPPSGLLAGQALGRSSTSSAATTSASTVPGTGLSAARPGRGVRRRAARHLRLRLAAGDPRARRRAARAGQRGAASATRRASDRERCARRLSALPGVVAFADSRALRDTVNSYLGPLLCLRRGDAALRRRDGLRAALQRHPDRTSPNAPSKSRRCARRGPPSARSRG